MTSNDRPLRDVILEILKKYDLEEHLDMTKITGNWGRITGKLISSHTKNISFRNNILFVSLDSPALRQELHYNKKSC